MSKRRKEHDCCPNENSKRSKVLDEFITSEAILYVPDTPDDKIKQNKCSKEGHSQIQGSKLTYQENHDDDADFSDSDIDLEDINVDNIQSQYESYARFLRFKIISVEDNGQIKMLKCKNISSSDETLSTIRISGEWYYSEIMEGNFLHIIDTHLSPIEIEINNENSNMMIIHPDILVSPTTISSSVRCPRQAVLGEVFKPTVGYSSNEVMLLGTINHALFDAAIRTQQFNPVFLRKKLKSILEQDDIIDSLSCMDSKKDEMLKKLLPSVELISSWGKKFCQEKGGVISYGQKGDELTKIVKVLDIEENIWSPKYGCKGKVDATVRIHAQSKTKISPVEVKSGSSRNSLGSVDHRAQVILYTMMLEERYKDSIESGILYYIKGQQTIGVPSSGVERRALIVKRNEIAGALQSILSREEMKLPELVNDKMACKWCNHQLSCSLAFKSFEGKDTSTHPLPEILENNVPTISENHLQYFTKFSKLCIQEARSATGTAKMPWDEACKKYNKLTLSSVSENFGFYHLFKFASPINPRSSFMRLGDYVIISKVDGSGYNICAGFVTTLTPETIEVYSNDTNIEQSPHHRTGPSYFISPHQSLSGLHTSLGNVTSLMSPEDRAAKWRKLLLDGAAPTFSSSPFSFSQEAKFSEECGSDKLLTSLNPGQREAVEKAVATQDYLCILGMPGTGKTSTISCLVQLLAARGHTILLTAYTHSAVDNLVLKLPTSVDVVRLGAPGRIHPGNKERSSRVLTADIKDPQQLRQFYDNKAVVATTCLGLRHSVFEYKRFDYCIIDEASQITEPICLGPILLSDRCILVGDHHQLPPLVQSVPALQNGLGVSLFKRLCELHPETGVCELGIQYRMCTDIMLLANTLVYNNKLRCGDEKTARSMLRTRTVDGALPFVKKALQPATKVLFLDTSQFGVQSYESSTSTSICNVLESKIVALLCRSLVAAGIPEKDIGVLTPYNGQLDTLSEILSKDVELLTADRFQGRDKPCIVMSFTRSNKDKVVGSLLADLNRLNVSLTRAKSKLIMVGNIETLSRGEVLAPLFSVLEKKCWVFKIPRLEYEAIISEISDQSKIEN